ncbi:hypothetical protein XM47_14230 [Catenovulum maritimum]|uniref:Fatty acid hydroxylase domain-containing protein n=2 Tax=Catenovulum maritimum TaxID=1513271 RepID=A0A0J8GUX0_9ALTE|nr:hypothetical protein XM47_14230 [Catenovulum maritimum]
MNSEYLAWINQLAEQFNWLINPASRIYWLYLLASMPVVIIYTKIKPQNNINISGIFFNPKYWWNRSTKHDYFWMACNQVLLVLILTPIVWDQLSVAININRALINFFGMGDLISLPHLSLIFLFSFSLFILEDFSRFFVHWLYHKVPFLWRFHAIHHSATTLTPFTLYRVHSIEFLINNLRWLFVTGITSGIFMYLFSGKITVIEILGVNIFNFTFNLVLSNLRHSHIYIGFGRLEKLFISPAQHQIHHSLDEKHFNRNFGSCLAIWDRLFKSWLSSKDESILRFGISKKPPKLSGQLRAILN